MSEEKQTPTIQTLDEAGGAVYRAIYVERKVMIYGVTDHELRTISVANATATIMFSAMTFLLGVAASIWIGVATSGVTGDAAKILSWVVAPVCSVLAIIFLVVALVAMRYRGGEIKRIIEESRGGLGARTSV